MINCILSSTNLLFKDVKERSVGGRSEAPDCVTSTEDREGVIVVVLGRELGDTDESNSAAANISADAVTLLSDEV
jgi:hypothetical protein